MEMNVLFSSDDNYAQHLAVAIYSLLEHNQWAEVIRVFVIDNHISQPSVLRLRTVIASFNNAELHWLSFDSCSQQLRLTMQWPISISAYARLFAAELVPQAVNRILYLDCDIVVNSSLSELWSFDLDDCCLGAVQDLVPPATKKAVGIPENAVYFNSGLLLIDLKKWRQQLIGYKCEAFLDKQQGNVLHHDQGVLNGIFLNGWKKLPLRYNVMTIYYIMPYHGIRNYWRDFSEFYTEEEIAIAKVTPAIIHFTPSFTTHPWEENCKHPFSSLYHQYLAKTPWSNTPLCADCSKWYVRLINWRYRNFPILRRNV